jgi:hypothetical protein
MLTRLAVFFSLLILVAGIWLSMPGVNTNPKIAPQFSVIEKKESDLSQYQKKPRKYNYETKNFEPSEVVQSSPLQNSDKLDVVDTSNTEVAVEKQSPIFETTQIKKIQPSDLVDDRQSKTLIIAYSPKQVIVAKENISDVRLKEQVLQTSSLIIGFASSTIPNGSTAVTPNQSFNLTFSKIPDQSVISKLKFLPETPFTQTLNGNTLTITPKNMERDTTYVFGSPNIWPCKESISYICQNKDNWSYRVSFKTDYKEVQVYGKSVQNRDLITHLYGSCSNQATCKTIMLTGGLHGSEWRSGDLSQLKTFLDQNPQEIIGKNKIIAIIPYTNPDGTALNTRYNANGVNLNRNFSELYQRCDACGAGPVSENETIALANLTTKLKPNILISYHSQWPPDGIIFRGDDLNPKTVAFAEWVSERTGYQVGVFPDFAQVPGDQTVWAETQGIPSLVIESSLLENSDWSQNFNLYLSLIREF